MEFHPFSPIHFLTVLIAAAITVTLCAAGRRGAEASEFRLRSWWVRGIWVVQTLNLIYYATLRPVNFAECLPLHVCDIMGWVAGVSLATQHPWARVASVYFGICLCSQAFATPIVQVGPDTARFWLFFVGHLQIVGSAIYELAVLGFVPRWRHAGMAMVMLCLYGALMLPLNIATTWNYGFVGNSAPEAPTIIDALGPWPHRLLWLFAITLALFTGFTLVSNGVRRLNELAGGGRAGGAAPGGVER